MNNPYETRHNFIHSFQSASRSKRAARFILEQNSHLFFFESSTSNTINKMKLKIPFFLLALALMTNRASAQTEEGNITGIIMDDSNKTHLSGATIFIEELNKGCVTDKYGKFSFSHIPFGTYTFTIKFISYQTKKQIVKIENGDVREIIIGLKPESRLLEEVMIMGKNEIRKIREQAMPVSVISMKQLQGTVNNVQDVLAKTAGVTVRATGGTGSASRISVRGLEGKRIGLFIDGNPINDNSDFIDINDIPVEMIDRIEIYKGIVPARFGGSAVGGAVNIVIREYPPKYLDANYSWGSYHTHKASLVSKMNIAPQGIELGLGGFYDYAENNYKMRSPFQQDLVITRDHDRFKKLAIGGSFKARKWRFDLIEFEPVFLHTFKEIQGIESNIQYAHNYSNAFIFANKIEKENFGTEGLDLNWQLGYIYTDYHFIDTASYRTHWDGTHYQPVSRLGGEIGKWASLLKNKKHQLQHKVNLDYLINEHHSVNLNSLLKYAHANPQDHLKDQVIGYRTNFTSNMLSWTVGFNCDYRTLNDKFLSSIHIKYYYYTIKTKMASVLMNDAEDIHTKKQDFGISTAFRYRITSHLMVKTSLGYDVRLPAEEELLGDGYVIAPAGNLIPERNASVNVGIQYDRTDNSSGNLQIELNGYYMYLKNMIRFTGGYLQSQYQNFGKMRTFGVETEIKADMTPWLYGYFNATFQDLRDRRKYEQNTTVPNPTKGCRMPNIPYLMANVGLEFHKENLFGGKGMNTRLFTDASFIEEYLYDFEQSRYQQRRIPRTFSYSMGFDQSFKKGRYFLMGKINNLTNTRMMSEFNRPLPGRNFQIRIRYVFK